MCTVIDKENVEPPVLYMHIQACVYKSFTHQDEARIILNVSVKKM